MKKAPAHNKASTPAKTKLAPNETAIPLAEAGFVLFQFFVVCFFFYLKLYINYISCQLWRHVVINQLFLNMYI